MNIIEKIENVLNEGNDYFISVFSDNTKKFNKAEKIADSIVSKKLADSGEYNGDGKIIIKNVKDLEKVKELFKKKDFHLFKLK